MTVFTLLIVFILINLIFSFSHTDFRQVTNSAVKKISEKDLEYFSEDSEESDKNEEFDHCPPARNDMELQTNYIAIFKVIHHHFAPKEYQQSANLAGKLNLNLEKLMFVCNYEKIPLKGPRLQRLKDARNFALYATLIDDTQFKQMIWAATTRLAIFIGLQFPIMVTTSEEIFELFHAVIALYYNYDYY